MLTRRSVGSARFSRQDIPRVAIAAGILILALTAILGADILPEAPLDATVGQLATRDIVAPRAVDFVSTSQTDAARQAAMNAVPPQYTFTSENAIRIAADQQVAFKTRVSPIDTTFSANLSDEGRASLLKNAVPDLTPDRPRHARRAQRCPVGGGQDRGRTDPGRDTPHATARFRGRRPTR